MFRLLIPILALVAAVVAIVVADVRPAPKAAGSYTYIDHSPVFTLDPQRMAFEQDLRLGNALYDGLVRWDPYTFEIIPGVAERWDVSHDRLNYTFHLRPNARWSNGDPVTAHDFAYSWQRGLMPDTAADYTKLFLHLAGARAFFDWRLAQTRDYAARPAAERTPQAAADLRDAADRAFRDMVGVRVLDDRTLEVRVERPTPYFLDLLAFAPMFPVHRPTVERWVRVDPDSGRLEQRHDWTKPPLLVTNGAYRLETWRFKRDMRLERNEFYWNAQAVRAPSVTILVIEDPNTRALAFQTGAADWVTEVQVDYVGDMLAAAARGERDDIQGFSRFGTYFWSFNCTPTLTSGLPNPFHDARVRRAFAMAVNKRDITDKVRGVGETPASTFIPPGSIPGFDEDRSLRGAPHDPDAARRLLAEAGWKDRNGDGALENPAGVAFPVVEMLCSTGSYHQQIALAMGAMWERELGVRTRVVSKETKTYRQDLARRDYMVARGGWYGDYSDPMTFHSLHRTGDGNNDRGYSNPAFDAMLEAADNERDPARRLAILEEAERFITEEELPILPIWTYRQFYLFNPRTFHGLSGHPRMLQRLDYLWAGEPDTAEDAGSRP